MQLSLELFAEAPETSIDFYRRVLGFASQGSSSTEYTMLKNGDAMIAINSRSAFRPIIRYGSIPARELASASRSS